MLVRRDDMLEIDGSLIMPKIVFEASGHLSSLVDPIVQCTKCGTRIRADKYICGKDWPPNRRAALTRGIPNANR